MLEKKKLKIENLKSQKLNRTQQRKIMGSGGPRDPRGHIESNGGVS